MRRRGFTVAELMIAVTAGLAVSAAAYMLSKTSLDVFQSEARMNAAQFSGMMGMNRLTADIKRAGFQTTLEVARDPSVCARPPAGGSLSTLLNAVRVRDGVANAAGYSAVQLGLNAPLYDMPPAFAFNNRDPDHLVLSGNFASSSNFRVSAVNTTEIRLDVAQLPVQRLALSEREGGPGICDVFGGTPIPNGTPAANDDLRPIDLTPVRPAIIRFSSKDGQHRFATLTDCVSTPNPLAITDEQYTAVILTVALPNDAPCVDATTAGTETFYVNPVNVVEYALVPVHGGANSIEAGAAAVGLPASMSVSVNCPGPQCERGFAAEDAELRTAGDIGGTLSRVALVRRQLDANITIIPSSGEVVADYVVDLNFNARRIDGAGVLQPVAFEGNVGGVPPNELRSLGVRLSTRARTADRTLGQDPNPTADLVLARFRVGDPAVVGSNSWARVRTMFSQVTLPNFSGPAFP
jgi:hypothetical protein